MLINHPLLIYTIVSVSYYIMFLLFHVFLSRLLYSAKGISTSDILLVICLGPDVALNKSKVIILSLLSFIISHFINCAKCIGQGQLRSVL